MKERPWAQPALAFGGTRGLVVLKGGNWGWFAKPSAVCLFLDFEFVVLNEMRKISREAPK